MLRQNNFNCKDFIASHGVVLWQIGEGCRDQGMWPEKFKSLLAPAKNFVSIACISL